MSDPTLNTKHVAEGLGRLLTQFKGKPHLEGVLQSFLEQVQELEVVFFALMAERYVLTAVGAQLDGIGRLVGEARAGRDDTNYRAAILGRITRNAAHSRVEDIITLFTLILPGHTTVVSQNGVLGPAAMSVDVLDAITPPDPSVETVSAELQAAKGAGVRTYLIYSGFPASQSFTFAPASVPVTDALRGFSDVAKTTGGRFVGVS